MPKQSSNKRRGKLSADSQPETSSAKPVEIPPEDKRWQELCDEQGWNHFKLYNAVRETLFALPAFFKSELNITGVLATDLYTFNSALGATIENQIVEALNELRRLWDADNEYLNYRFVRQAQRFPDVILRAAAPGKDTDVIMGIELKGWYALAKEREPSFRYTVSPAVCAPWDLLAVYPWALSEVISGKPQLFQPFVTSAHYAAELRNWYWQNSMTGRGDKSVALSTVNRFYPAKSDMIADRPASDSGNNFGRLARYGIMDKYMTELREERLSGIPLDAWQRFLSSFREDRPEETTMREIDRLIADIGHKTAALSNEDIEEIRGQLSAIIDILGRSNK